MKNDDVSIESGVRNYRSLIVFSNKRCGSLSVVKWFHKSHSKYINYEKIIAAVEELGYSVNKDCEQYNLFTPGGMFWDIVEQFNDDKDVEKLKNVIDIISSYRPTHRLFLEEIPTEVVDALIQTTLLYHTSILLLYRKKPINRLLSLWYAMHSGISTPEDIRKNNFDPDEFRAKRIDVDWLIDNQKKVNKINSETWRMLQIYGPRYVSAGYEDFFISNDYTIMHITLRWLFYNTWDFADLLETGHMNLDKYYHKMKGSTEVDMRLQELRRPRFPNFHVDV